LFLERRPELAGQGFSTFLRNHFQPSRKRMSGADRPAKQVQSFRKVFFEFVEPSTAFERNKRNRKQRGDNPDRKRVVEMRKKITSSEI